MVVLREVTQERRRERDRELLAEVAARFAETLDGDAALSQVAGLLVRELADLCGSLALVSSAPARRIRLEFDGDVTGIWDPHRVAEALSNIAGNAIDHAAPGTAVVVKAHGEDQDVVIEVINQGDPIPADVLPFIFEPFRRAKQREKSPAGHLGLGLYIANQMVHSDQGSLAAYSVDGTTTFLMRLPRQPLAPVQPADRLSGHRPSI